MRYIFSLDIVSSKVIVEVNFRVNPGEFFRTLTRDFHFEQWKPHSFLL